VIPFDYITEWRAEAPWIDDAQVEQDLVISRALVEIFRHPALADSLALRGARRHGALQAAAPAARAVLGGHRSRADYGAPRRADDERVARYAGTVARQGEVEAGEGRITFYFRFTAEGSPVPLRLKVETNTREHFALYGLRKAPFKVASRWFEGACDIQTYELDELLGTKLRALYQRKQARDLFDLEIALTRLPVDPQRIVSAFLHYMAHDGHPMTRAQIEQNLALKIRDGVFLADLSPLLAGGEAWDPVAAEALVSRHLVALLPGEPWKGEER
jgi:hypothetical protein